MQIINTPKAPMAIGPYSQGIVSGEMIFTSGQIALDTHGNMSENDIKVQTRVVLENLEQILNMGGSALDRVLKTTVFLANMEDFAEMNEVYAEFFKQHKPARSTVAVKTLPKNALVEIECIALK